MSCCMVCSAVFNWAATACCVESSFEEALQPNAKPPMAIKPKTITAGRVQAGDSVRVSMILSSDIFNLSPHLRLGDPPHCKSACTQKVACAKPKETAEG